MGRDAWKQFQDLCDRYTVKLSPRSDFEVIGLGHGRSVEIKLAKASTGPRNVGTMREFATAILEACDFVEEVNPEWTARGKKLWEEK